MKDRSWNNCSTHGWRLVIVGLVAGFLLICSSSSKADYSFPPRDIITMDVVKTYGGGGTWLCPSLRECYIKTLRAESRGANQYCESVTIKRNGIVVWQRHYQPYSRIVWRN